MKYLTMKQKPEFNLQLFAAAEDEDIDKGNEGEETPDDGDEDETNEGEEVKTFTQDEVDKFIKDRLTREQTKWDKAIEKKVADKIKESQRLSELSEDELKAETLTQKEQEIEEREQRIRSRELLIDAEDALRERKLPADFAPFLLAEDEEATMENINVFKKAFNDAVKSEVKNELTGETPQVNKNKDSTLTRKKIAKIKDPKKRVAALKELYK